MISLRSVPMAAAIFALLAGPAQGVSLTVGALPNSGPATQNCGPGGPLTSDSLPIQIQNTCFRADVGTATGSAIAAAGHVGAAAHADSHNGDSLFAGIGAQGLYRDFIVFHSADPNAHSAAVSANLLLDGVFEANGPTAGSFLDLIVTLGGSLLRLAVLNGGATQNDFVFDFGQLGPATHLGLHTPFVTVPLDSPVMFRLNLQVSASAGGPGSHGLIDFAQNSLKLAGDAFALPAGVTANAGSYLVDNHYTDPLAVPEPAGWAMLLAGLGGLAACMRRRARGQGC